MIHYGTKDYIEAEKIVLGQGAQYFFSGPYLHMRHETDKRNVPVEAALIDLLMSYDNEGGKVEASAQPASESIALRHRLNHLRKHVDPDYLNYQLAEYRQKFGHMIGRKKDDFDLKYPTDPHLYMIGVADTAMRGIDRARERYPDLRFLKAGEDSPDNFRNMAKAAGMTVRKNAGNEFDRGRADFMMCIADDEDDDSFSEYLPLLRESLRDDAALEIRVAMHDVTTADYQSAIADCPRGAEMYEAYLTRLPHMAEEAKSIEEQLAALHGEEEKKNRELRNSEHFAKTPALNLRVDPDHLERVKNILSDYYPTGPQQPVATNKGSTTAHRQLLQRRL